MKIANLKNEILQRSILLALFVSLLLSSTRGQSFLNTSQILRQYIQRNESFIPYGENVKFLNQKKQGLPLLNEISLRTESDEFELNKQRYQARFRFNTNKERISNQKIIESKKERYQIRQDVFLLSQLEEIYTSLVDFYFISQEIKYQEEELLILQDKKQIFQKLLAQGQNFDVEKWLKNEENILEINSKLIKNRSVNAELKARIQVDGGEDEEFLFDDWLTINRLRLFISDSTINANLPPGFLINIIKEEEAKAEYQLEKSKANKWLDFVQFEYKGNKKLPYNKEISLGAGIKIPLRAFHRVKMNDAYLEILESEYKSKMDAKKYSKSMSISFSNLERLFVEYDLFQDYIKTQKIQETYDTYLGNLSISPLLLLNIKQILIDQKKTSISIQKEIFEKYIRLLSDSGILVRSPLRNYLNEEFKFIP